MNNTQLFEQSARKILSKNQLESVMQLHNALFGAQDAEQVADTVATAVKDAVDDVVDTAADEQVITDVAEASPSIMSLEDQQNLTALVDSMSDNEKVNFLESLDDQQIQILMEGPMTWVKNLFSTAGRKANRLEKFGKLATKDAKLSERLDRIMGLDPYNLSSRNAKKAEKLFDSRQKVRQKMNDLRFKASGKAGTEYNEMMDIGLNKGSRNFNVNELANTKEQIEFARNQEIEQLENSFKENLRKLEEQQKIAPILPANHKKRLNKLINDHYKARDEVIQRYQPQLNEIDQRINMVNREARLSQPSSRYFGNAQANRNPFSERNRRFNGNPNAGMYVDQYGIPFYARFGKPGLVNSLINRIPVIGTVNQIRIGAWKAFKGALKLGALAGLTYGGYKLYDIITNPEDINLEWIDLDGSKMDTAKTVAKAIAVIGGGIAGKYGAQLLGFDSTTGKTVGALVGSLLAAYFMFLNDGDEGKAKEMLKEYSSANETDQEAINEALKIDGLSEALHEMFDAGDAQ